jgi:Ca-activated chloride channel family protein
MTTRTLRLLSPVFALLLAVIACTGNGAGIGGSTVTISIAYGSEKEAWLEAVTEEFNDQRYQTESGATIMVETTPIGSIESAEAILDGTMQPTIWSPASKLYIPVANEEWRAANGTPLVEGDPNELVLSPVVIAMWQPMAEALGWPEDDIGWADIAELAISDEGWSQYGYPEWGDFKFGHTHPGFSNSGFTSVIAEFYAGAGKTRDLTLEDLNNPEARAFVEQVEKSVIHYGSSTGFFGRRMFERGPSYLSAAVLYENLIVEQETKRLSGESAQLPVVAIYPSEGTFWSDHPYAVLNAPWVTEEQAEAADIYEAYLLAEPQQRRALEFGFRPADPAIALTAPLDAQHGVDVNQPQTILEVPDAEVLAEILPTWRTVKKPVDLVVLIDISGSMQGEKISAARASLIDFIDLLDDRDRLQVIAFHEQLIEITPLTELGPKRDDVRTRVSGIIECCGTRLYDALDLGYEELEGSGDPEHIRAIVVLSDGEDTQSQLSLDQILNQVGDTREGGNATKVFTIGYGDDADEAILTQIAETTGVSFYQASPQTIREIYAAIATFF